MCDTLGCGATCELHGECYKAKCYCDIGWDGTNCDIKIAAATILATPTKPTAESCPAEPSAPVAAASGASLKIKASFTANSIAELAAQEDGIKTAMAAWLGVSASDIAIEWASARRRLLATYGVRGERRRMLPHTPRSFRPPAPPAPSL